MLVLVLSNERFGKQHLTQSRYIALKAYISIKCHLMKTIFTIFLTFCIAASLPAQFGPPQLISLSSDTPGGRQYIRTADVDGDGWLDILVASDFNNVIRYFHNRGNFSFDGPALLSASWKDLKAMEVADLNNDGRPDVVSLDVREKKLYWHRNTAGTFPEQEMIVDSLETVFSRILCQDFNGDSNIDIVLLNHGNAIIMLNDGLGNFSEPQNILPPEDETELYDNVVGDFNNDGFIDLALASGGFTIYLNDGAGKFTKSTGGGIEISFLLESADYNNDGLDDILMVASKLVPYQNSPSGFSVVGSFSPNNEHYQTIFSSDLDNDGDLDVISEDDQTNAFFWYENVDGGNSWIRHTISIGFEIPTTIYGVRAADLDGDGDNDLIRTSLNGDVAIYENQLVLSIGNIEKPNFKLFPNPASEFLTIDGNSNRQFSVAMYDLLGNPIFINKKIETNSQIDISSIESGNYIVKIIEGSRTEVRKLIIVH